MNLETIVTQLRELQAHRVASIRTCTSLVNRTKALLRRMLGYDVMLPKAERDRISKAATRVYKAILEGKPVEDPREKALAEDENCIGFVLATRAAIEPYASFRAKIVKQMERLARELPSADFAQSVRGFGLKALAVIVGEAGDLSDYANPGKLWKRLGLAPKEAYRDVTKDGKECFKIPRRRRSELWVIGTCVIKMNGSNGEYYRLFVQRKEYEADRVETPKHAERRAHRYMEKRLVRELWKAWNPGSNRDSQCDSETQRTPAVPV